jgi:histidinol dehydrogenase
LEATVQSVLLDIKANGQSAVKKYTLQFDKVDLENILVSNDEFSVAEKSISS